MSADTKSKGKPKGSKAIESANACPVTLPVMPTISPSKYVVVHRDHIPKTDTIQRICVARPVSQKEVEQNADAQASMDAEWDKLEKQVAWLIEQVEEWYSVSASAKASNDTIHVGRVFGLCVEKGSELPKGHKG